MPQSTFCLFFVSPLKKLDCCVVRAACPPPQQSGSGFSVSATQGSGTRCYLLCLRWFLPDYIAISHRLRQTWQEGVIVRGLQSHEDKMSHFSHCFYCVLLRCWSYIKQMEFEAIAGAFTHEMCQKVGEKNFNYKTTLNTAIIIILVVWIKIYFFNKMTVKKLLLIVLFPMFYC